MLSYLQVKHTKTGDIHGQKLEFNTTDEMLLEYHSQMKNAINNADVIGMSINVLNDQLTSIDGFPKQWFREVTE